MAIRKIGKIRRYLDKNTTKTLVHAYVTSRLDSNNSLLYGLNDSDLSRIQRVQNTAARLISLTPRSQHITPILQSLHWLPIRSRIIFKMLLLTYKAKYGLSPCYLQELIHEYEPTRSLRSSNKLLLSASANPRTKFYGERSFQYAASHLWNNLPMNIRRAPTVTNFKSMLKTHLFGSVFD